MSDDGGGAVEGEDGFPQKGRHVGLIASLHLEYSREDPASTYGKAGGIQRGISQRSKTQLGVIFCYDRPPEVLYALCSQMHSGRCRYPVVRSGSNSCVVEGI